MATGGEPGGVRIRRSGLKVRLAICIHSSRVFKNVVQVDFTRFPVSSPTWNPHSTTKCKIKSRLTNLNGLGLAFTPLFCDKDNYKKSRMIIQFISASMNK